MERQGILKNTEFTPFLFTTHPPFKKKSTNKKEASRMVKLYKAIR